ncbi:WD40-repeat-containing domain protein [Ochromonadaceae sp. CCMP2298]|nr:WD40-repeat-containing domain protein [Ochromonadaceae sp. CCMP2298]|mmetsp:Transcript_6373/g.14093  ORF Transcript_6373/g.14093 Transcript_6373/m.14093 type:complete len:390 (-) Transcript_6373:55-1224(-)|eukprot:CAMPEP_0173199860 /NCGR_PEP_ID=MMETSP1141-20130122/17468_1 /TAXON_ID=483371 /ORGANISM="non described non described, Strain CCMP2298" /LENGTH=389 /DNA_ID=CAMNT_0014124793 /DNA_START=129 /DNA_END=1298 /DNA_ORIENTATION=-
MATEQQLAPPTQGISCHAWNADKSMIAISPNNNELRIYETKTWKMLHLLAEHDMMVSAIDWSAVTNKIVSCSHDRNAFVWTFQEDLGTWKPALVILRIDRGALDVKWSSDGLRFALTSGAKCVPVCTYENANDWWVCKMVKKKFKSTVLCCAFHPSNGQLLATGCADFKCRVFSTFGTDVDGTNVNPGPFANSTGPLEFGEVYAELSALGWIHAVAWSPSGNTLAYTGHDSSVHFADLTTAQPNVDLVVRSVRLPDLPLCSMLFVSEVALIGGGHDFNPTIFTLSGGKWSIFEKVDKGDGKEVVAVSGGTVSAARELFRNKTIRGQDIKKDTDTIKTRHERAIMLIQDATPPSEKKAGCVTTISTSALDGKLILWNLPSLEINMAALGV